MINFFRKIKEKESAERQRLAEEQRQREERLRQLEEATKKQKGFHIINPIKTVQNKKEMKQLRKEIADYEEKKKHSVAMGMLIGMCVLCFGIIGITSGKKEETDSEAVISTQTPIITESIGSRENKNTEPSTEREIIDPTTTPTIAPETINPYNKTTTAEIPTQKETIEEELLAQEEPTELDAVKTENDELDIPKLTADDLKVTTINDYGHINTDVIFLGNGEGATITVTAPAWGLIADDILFLYDESLLSVQVKDPFDRDDKTYFQYYVTGKETSCTQIVIVTTYDYLTSGDEAAYYCLDVIKLDSSNGKVCYVTPTGEKYHFSEACAGEDAIKTTYQDATACEYEPCGKCVK